MRVDKANYEFAVAFQRLAFPVAQVSFCPLKNIKVHILVSILKILPANRCDRMLLTCGNCIYYNYDKCFLSP